MLRLPAYSSFLSSVETVFAILKQRIAKHMARLPKDLGQEEFEAEIKLICEEVAKLHSGRRLFFAARKDLLRALEHPDDEDKTTT